jgi:hypothetical protein
MQALVPTATYSYLNNLKGPQLCYDAYGNEKWNEDDLGVLISEETGFYMAVS